MRREWPYLPSPCSRSCSSPLNLPTCIQQLAEHHRGDTQLYVLLVGSAGLLLVPLFLRASAATSWPAGTSASLPHALHRRTAPQRLVDAIEWLSSTRAPRMPARSQPKTKRRNAKTPGRQGPRQD